jgi:DNA (cytosine-5)-methyltransferase 1
MQDPKFIVVDLFCGAGGTTTGFVMTGGKALVAACVNHDHKAIKSHWRNNPEVEHFEEDITKLYGYLKHGLLFHSPEFLRLIRLVNLYRAFYPNAKVILWASLECTNFSKAKGGLPRDPDSRTLADHLHYYIDAIAPDYIQIENVVEFRDWGPMRIKCTKLHKDRCDLMLMKNKKGQIVYGWEPIPEKRGEDFKRWCKKICVQGYLNDWNELNSADFGAYTSRNRLFGIFSRPELPIAWPEPTHYKPKKAKAKKQGKKLRQTEIFQDQPLHIETKERWKAVKNVLDFSDEGKSIFNRKKPLSEKTLQRIFAGLVKYVGQDDNEVNDYFKFLAHYYGSGGQHSSVENPSPTIPTKARSALVSAEFITIYNGKSLHTSIDDPCPVIPTKDRFQLVKPKFNGKPFLMPTHYNNVPKSVDEPAPALLSSRRHTYIVNPSHGGHATSTEAPCPVIVARQDKAPLSLVQTETGIMPVAILETDSRTMIAIKEFMVVYGLVDIKMRMLRVDELLAIQGFPKETTLIGNQADQKKQIGNSVVPLVVCEWTLALYQKIDETLKKAA